MVVELALLPNKPKRKSLIPEKTKRTFASMETSGDITGDWLQLEEDTFKDLQRRGKVRKDIVFEGLADRTEEYDEVADAYINDIKNVIGRDDIETLALWSFRPGWYKKYGGKIENIPDTARGSFGKSGREVMLQRRGALDDYLKSITPDISLDIETLPNKPTSLLSAFKFEPSLKKLIKPSIEQRMTGAMIGELGKTGQRYPRGIFRLLEAGQKFEQVSPEEFYKDPEQHTKNWLNALWEGFKRGFVPEVYEPEEPVRTPTEIAWDMADRMYGDKSTSVAWEFVKNLPFTTAGVLGSIRLDPNIFLLFRGLNKVLTDPTVAKFVGKDIPAPKWFDNTIRGVIKGFHRPFETLAKTVRENRIDALTEEAFKKIKPMIDKNPEFKARLNAAGGGTITDNDLRGYIKKEFIKRGAYKASILEIQKRIREVRKFKPTTEVSPPPPARPTYADMLRARRDKLVKRVESARQTATTLEEQKQVETIISSDVREIRELDKQIMGLSPEAGGKIEFPQGDREPKPYEGLEPGTPGWMEIWKSRPDLQGEMVEYGKQFKIPRRKPDEVPIEEELTGGIEEVPLEEKMELFRCPMEEERVDEFIERSTDIIEKDPASNLFLAIRELGGIKSYKGGFLKEEMAEIPTFLQNNKTGSKLDELVNDLKIYGWHFESEDDLRQTILSMAREASFASPERIKRGAKTRYRSLAATVRAARKGGKGVQLGELERLVAEEAKAATPEYRKTVLAKLHRLTEIAPDVVTRKQVAVAHWLAQKKKLTPSQLRRIERIVTGKRIIDAYTKGGRIRRYAMTKKEAREVIRTLHRVFVKPYKKPTIPRKLKTAKGLQPIKIGDKVMRRSDVAKMIMQGRAAIPPTRQPKTLEDWHEFLMNLPGVGIERYQPPQYWMERYERNTGVPIYSEIYLKGEDAERQKNIFLLKWYKKVREIYGDLIKDVKARKKIEHYLEGEDIELTPEEKAVADKLRPVYDEAHGIFGLKNYVQNYQPRIRKAGGIRPLFGFKNIPNELRFFAEAERVGVLDPREDDSLKLIYKYLEMGAKKKFMQPWLENTKPIRKVLPSSTEAAVNDYVRAKLGLGRKGLQLAENTMRNLLKSMKVEVDPAIADTLSHFWFISTYGGALAYRLYPVARNFMQTGITTFPELGTRWFAYGHKMTYRPKGIATVRDEGFLLSWGIPFYKQIEGKIETGISGIDNFLKFYDKFVKTGLAPYSKIVDAQNRAITYWGTRGRFEHYWKRYQKKEIDKGQFEKGIDLDGYDAVVQDRIRTLLEEGRIKEALDLQIRDKIDGTQWPYRPGTEAGVGMPFGRYIFQFMVWPIRYAHTIVGNWAMRGQWDKLLRWLLAGYLINKAWEKAGISAKKVAWLGPLSGAGLSLGVQLVNDTATLARHAVWGNRRLIDKDIEKLKRYLHILYGGGLAVQDIKDFIKAYNRDWWVYNNKGRPVYQSSPSEELLRLTGFTPLKLERRREEWKRMGAISYEVQKLREKIVDLYLRGKEEEADRLNEEMEERYAPILERYGKVLKGITAREVIREEQRREETLYERKRRYMPGRTIKSGRPTINLELLPNRPK